MITIRVGKKKYKGVYNWNDISLRQFCDLAAIEIPASYEAYILADGKFDHERKDSIDQYLDAVLKLTDTDINEVFPGYFRKVIRVLSSIPDKVLTNEIVNDIYDSYFKPFVLSLIYHTPVIHFMGQIKAYEPDSITKFKIGIKTFYVPETVNIMGQDIPLANEPVISYSEASDIFRGMKVSKDDVNRLALFMAIYCRAKRERYNESNVLKRKELFMKAPMSVVWQVFFYTSRRLSESRQTILLFGGLGKQIHEVVNQARTYRSLVAVD